MIDVHFCDSGDVYVFGKNSLLWSPHGGLTWFGAQDKFSSRFSSFEHAIAYVRLQYDYPDRVKEMFTVNLETARDLVEAQRQEREALQCFA